MSTNNIMNKPFDNNTLESESLNTPSQTSLLEEHEITEPPPTTNSSSPTNINDMGDKKSDISKKYRYKKWMEKNGKTGTDKSELEEHATTEPRFSHDDDDDIAASKRKQAGYTANRLIKSSKNEISLEEHPTTEPRVSFQADDIEKSKQIIAAGSATKTTGSTNLEISAQVQKPPPPSSSHHFLSNNNDSSGFINVSHAVVSYQHVEDEEDPDEHATTRAAPELFTINDAFRVLTPEEQKRQKFEQELKNAPLIEGTPAPPPQDKDKEEWNFFQRNWITLIPAMVVILVIAIVVPLVLVAAGKRKKQNDIALLPSSSPSASLIPSFSPSMSVVPSSFPTTSSPTSETFESVVALVGLDRDIVSLNPDDYVFRSLKWMAQVDQITPQLLQQGMTMESQEAALQRFALVCFYYATNGDSWFDPLGFLNPSRHECLWTAFGRQQFLSGGVTIKCESGAVVKGIALSNNNLGGMLPSEIGLLTQLTWIELQNNAIGGTLPPSLSRLSLLTVLALNQNDLSGSIPLEITTLSNLETLWFRFNFLTGSIPESISNLGDAKFVDFWGNLLSGSIPSGIQNMTLLQALALNFNMLTSSLPTQINKIQSLFLYDVSGNSLTGTLPFEAGSHPILRIFNCGFNNLAGDLSALTHLSENSLTSLSFVNNQFVGKIPTEFCRFTLLQSLQGFTNRLTGSLPDCLGDLTSLARLALANNSLTGSIPTTLPTLLETLSLQSNGFTGKIPTGPFPRMITFSLFSNNFTRGTIPTELFRLVNLRALDLFECQLSGTIDAEIGSSLTQLTFLDLSRNSLNGTIPSEIGLLRNLESLGLSSNFLSGTIPSEVGSLTLLRQLLLNVNFLTGPLPSTFVNLPVTTLGQLSLNNNSLMGDVGFFCQDRSVGIFLADCQELKNCSCCTGCCDSRTALVGTQCLDIFGNL